MIEDLEHPLWRDGDLDRRLKDRLSDSYDGCVSSLSLINDILVEILHDTKTLDIQLQKVSFLLFDYTSQSLLGPLEVARALNFPHPNSLPVDVAETKGTSCERYEHSERRLSPKLAQRRILEIGKIETTQPQN